MPMSKASIWLLNRTTVYSPTWNLKWMISQKIGLQALSMTSFTSDCFGESSVTGRRCLPSLTSMLRSPIPTPLLKQYRHMKSGGYLQFTDIECDPQCDDGTMPEDTVFKRWEHLASEFRKASHRHFFSAPETKKELNNAGFVDIQERRYKLPIGVWSSNPRYRDLGKVSLSFPGNV